jgi:hypothetical protein
MNIRTKEISIGRVDLMRMGTTYISELQKKEKNVVVVATKTINVARGTCCSRLKKSKPTFSSCIFKNDMRMGTTYISEFQKREKYSSCSHGNYKCSSRYM